MPAFWDASALVPICVPGQAGAHGRRLLREQKPVVWWGTRIEVRSAIARLSREGHLPAERAQVASRRLALLSNTWREVQPVEAVREVAEDLLDRFNVRAADAMQLAAALVWCGQRSRHRIFVCLDERLSEAARQAGFTVIDV